ncbi:phage tail assembly chaperone [Pseudomonas protegens]|uniref:phage tail assembly chaperone n=1 Tax=Pseudomonas protegens TaxID=380021 RepID=UPI00383BD29F
MFYANWVPVDQRFAFSVDDNGGVPVTAERHSQLFGALAEGKALVPDADGAPTIADPLPVDSSPAALARLERAWRDVELSSVVWLRDRHRDQQEIEVPTTLTSDQFNELLMYMQTLRNWPQSSDFPQFEHRPVAPLWIAEQTE